MAVNRAHGVIESKRTVPVPGGKAVKTLRLTLLTEQYAICRLSPDDPVPPWAMEGPFYAIMRTPEELSILCLERRIPSGIRCQMGWRAFKVHGPLDFGEVGVLARLTGILAAAGIPILAISSFDTDYVLVQDRMQQQAVAALRSAGVETEAGS
jgi:hypothetical protein